MQTLDGWLSVISFDLADSAFNNQWFMQIKKRSNKTSNRNDSDRTVQNQHSGKLGKGPRPSVWPRFWYFWKEMCFCFENGEFGTETRILRKNEMQNMSFSIQTGWFWCFDGCRMGYFGEKWTDLTPILITSGHFAKNRFFSTKSNKLFGLKTTHFATKYR